MNDQLVKITRLNALVCEARILERGIISNGKKDSDDKEFIVFKVINSKHDVIGSDKIYLEGKVLLTLGYLIERIDNETYKFSISIDPLKSLKNNLKDIIDSLK